jgi:glycerol-3-phosphate dehydrogenase subunit B
LKYDCIIIGGGIAGLTCGIKCASKGLRTALISNGMNSLHFSSGSIDLFGYNGNETIENPFEYLKKLIIKNKKHPYSIVGIKTIKESLAFVRDEVMKENLELYSNGEQNHFHVTCIGTLKPSYLSQKSVFNEKIKNAFDKKEKLCILNFDGYRDYFSEITASQLKKNTLWSDIEITSGKITLPFYYSTEKNLHEFRSIDIARVFDSERYLPRIADEIVKVSGDARIVSLPAFISINNFQAIHNKLEEMTGKLIYEGPTLPPSILGLRLDTALRSRFAALGGEYSIGDKVESGNISDGQLEYITTKNYGNTRLQAKNYLIATGSFFSGGLKSSFDKMEEPIFNLKFEGDQKRNKWYSELFFDKKSHPFLSYGIPTNSSLNPFDKNGQPVKNLFTAGAILSGYDPIAEGSGCGVAISTGYFSAKKIIEDCKGKQ